MHIYNVPNSSLSLFNYKQILTSPSLLKFSKGLNSGLLNSPRALCQIQTAGILMGHTWYGAWGCCSGHSSGKESSSSSEGSTRGVEPMSLPMAMPRRFKGPWIFVTSYDPNFQHLPGYCQRFHGPTLTPLS